MNCDAQQLKQAASGRWLEILSAVGGIDHGLLDGKHHPCPKCGGNDRFRLIDREAGAVLCNQCFSEANGDGFSAVMWLCDCDFPTAVAKVAEYLDLSNGSSRAESDNKPQPKIVATYDYCDESGRLLKQVCRTEPKGFRQRRPKPGGEWEWSTKGVRETLYRLPELRKADPSHPVWIPEGERDVDRLRGLGCVATCNAGGAGKWRPDYAQYLKGRRVVLLPDKDQPGRKHAEQVAASLQGVASSVKVVELPGLPEKGDVSDWLDLEHDLDELWAITLATPEWTSASRPWPAIIPFDALDLPDFPTWALPVALRQWVEAESHATQTPADLAGLLALAVCSATIARRVEVEPRLGWREPVNLFVAVLLEPGNRKSAVFTDAIQPLRELEAELIEAERPNVARNQSDRRQSEARLRKLEKLAAEKGNAEASREACSLAAELAEGIEPVLPRLIVDDATSEKLGIMLAEQGGRIASMSPEGGVFDLMAGLYSKSGIPQFGVYLMGHSGDDLTTDRVSRKSVRVERPALTCAYTMQPAVVRGLADKAAFRGRGLLARFLYAAPHSWIGWREIAPTPVSEAQREAYRAIVRKLANTQFGSGNTGSAIEPFALRLADDASAAFRDWETEIESMLRDGGEMENVRDWGAKLAGATLRIAAVLHCVEHGAAGSIGRPTIKAAAEIARYLIPHAEAVLNMMQAKEGSADDDAHYVLRWIERHRCEKFTKTKAQHHGKRRFPKANDIDPALEELTRRGYTRSLPTATSGPGRPPSPSYEVNPGLFENAKPPTRSHNSQNSARELESDNSGNIGSAFQQPDNTQRVQVTI